MIDKEPTRQKKLLEAHQVGKKAGLKYLYLGNIVDSKHASTYCPKCGKLLVERDGYNLLGLNIKRGVCLGCGQKIAGVW
jgi:pyruvate formate lyase activating enzyme